mmetsp:Transcript_31257/g.76258  ORF Transcript_31257/g.76258 Transcript_31257/m.76258 type:complete len:228 (-) Transcript_31257:349-1032(-)
MDPLRGDDYDEEDGQHIDPIDELIATFQGVVSQGRRKITIIPHLNSGELKQNVRQLEDLYASAKELIEKIDEEGQETPNAGRYARTIKLCMREMERFEDQYQRVMDAGNLRRYSLENDEERRTMLIEGQLMRENTSAIEEVSKRLHDTKETGGMIMHDLKGQSSTLKRTAAGILDTNEVLKESKRVLDGMARSAATNKLTTMLIILLEVFIICIIVYYKFIYTSDGT